MVTEMSSHNLFIFGPFWVEEWNGAVSWSPSILFILMLLESSPSQSFLDLLWWILGCQLSWSFFLQQNKFYTSNQINWDVLSILYLIVLGVFTRIGSYNGCKIGRSIRPLLFAQNTNLYEQCHGIHAIVIIIIKYL